jgi:hypothetical protein
MNRNEFRKATVKAQNMNASHADMYDALTVTAHGMIVCNAQKPDVLAIREAVRNDPNAFLHDVHPCRITYPFGWIK